VSVKSIKSIVSKYKKAHGFLDDIGYKEPAQVETSPIIEEALDLGMDGSTLTGDLYQDESRAQRFVRHYYESYGAEDVEIDDSYGEEVDDLYGEEDLGYY
jgi:hypothetical protein